MEGLSRASFKPLRWDIINPRGPSRLERDTGGGPTFRHGLEGMPAYWQLVLWAGQHTDLSGYDLLYLCTDDIQFDIRAGKGLNHAAEDYFVGAGLSVRFR